MMTFVITLYAPKSKEFVTQVFNHVSSLLNLYERLDSLIDYFEGVYNTSYEIISIVRGGVQE